METKTGIEILGMISNGELNAGRLVNTDNERHDVIFTRNKLYWDIDLSDDSIWDKNKQEVLATEVINHSFRI